MTVKTMEIVGRVITGLVVAAGPAVAVAWLAVTNSTVRGVVRPWWEDGSHIAATLFGLLASMLTIAIAER